MAFLDNSENHKIIEIIKSYFYNSNSDNMRFLFINTDQLSSFAEFTSYLKNSVFKDTNFYNYDVSSGGLQNSFYPFLTFIKDNLRGSTEDELTQFLKTSKTYYFHREIFSTFFQGKPLSRYEEIAFEELDYEISELNNSIKNMLSEVTKEKNTVFVINGINILNKSSLDFIQKLIDSPSSGNVFFLFSIKTEHTFDSLDMNLYWDSFYSLINQKMTVLNLDTERIRDDETEFQIKPLLQIRKNIDELLQMANSSFHLLELPECLHCLKEIENLVNEHPEVMTFEKNKQFLILAGETHFLINESEAALYYYNQLIDIYIKSDNQKPLALIYRKLTYVHYRKENYEVAARYAAQSLKIYLGQNDAENLYYIYFLLFLINDKNKASQDTIQKQYYNILIVLGKKLKMYNSLIRVHNIYINTELPEGGIEEKLAVAEKSIELCKKYGNIYKLSSIYHNMGTLYSLVGDTNKSFEYYKKSEKLKVRIGNRIEIIRIYNGIGYGYFLVENYKKAISYFNKSLSYLKETKDYEEISLTFYNIAATSMFSQNYDSAIEYFEKTLSITNILKIKEIPFHPIVGIYCLLSFCYLKKGNFIKTLEYSNKTREMPLPTKNEDILYYKMILAFFMLKEKNVSEAHKTFEEILNIALTFSDLKMFIPFICFEFIQAFSNTEYSTRVKEVASLGIHISEELKYHFHKKLIMEYMEKGTVNTKDFYFKVKSFELQSIIDFASQHVTVNKLHKRIVEINFLNNIQQLLIQSKRSKQELINEVFNLIRNNFYSEESFLFFKENGTWMPYYPSNHKNPYSYFSLLDNLTYSQKEKLINNKEDIEFYSKFIRVPFHSLISIPLVNNDKVFGAILMLIRTSEFFFSEDDLRVLSIAAKQLSFTLTNKELEEKLEYQNSQLAKTVNRLKSIEKLTAVIYTEKDRRKAINYILTVLTSKIGLNYKCAIYYDYNQDSNQLVYKDYFYNFYSYAAEDIMINIENINTEIENYDCHIRKSYIALDKNPLIENSFYNGEIVSFKNSEYNKTLIPGIKLNFFCTLPIIHEEHMYGVIVLESFLPDFTIDDDEKDILRIFTSNLAIYLENQRLESERITNEKFETMIKLSSAIVHEVKTPLVGIKGFASIVKKKYSEDNKVSTYMDMIIKESNRVDDMATQLLEYSGRNHYKYKFITANIYELIEEVYELNRMDLEGNSFVWDTFIDKQLNIKCDKEQLLKAFSNLVKNSIEASTGINNCIRVSAYSESGTAVIELEDKGVGITNDLLPNIFEPLVTTKIQGTGLGLPIVENIIKMHNGLIEIFSQPNSGTKVILKFPLEK